MLIYFPAFVKRKILESRNMVSISKKLSNIKRHFFRTMIIRMRNQIFFPVISYLMIQFLFIEIEKGNAVCISIFFGGFIPLNRFPAGNINKYQLYFLVTAQIHNFSQIFIRNLNHGFCFCRFGVFSLKRNIFRSF